MSKVIHFEIAADEPEKLAEFYRNSLGWTIKEWEQEGVEVKEENRYWLIKAGPKEEMGADGGMYRRAKDRAISAGGPNAFICNVAVKEIEKVAEKIKANGGKAKEIMDMPEIGKSVSVEDPEGNIFALFEPSPDMKMMEM